MVGGGSLLADGADLTGPSPGPRSGAQSFQLPAPLSLPLDQCPRQDGDHGHDCEGASSTTAAATTVPAPPTAPTTATATTCFSAKGGTG